eukprot:9503825-Pyramimonas_sp.AAC.1
MAASSRVGSRYVRASNEAGLHAPPRAQKPQSRFGKPKHNNLRLIYPARPSRVHPLDRGVDPLDSGACAPSSRGDGVDPLPLGTWIQHLGFDSKCLYSPGLIGTNWQRPCASMRRSNRVAPPRCRCRETATSRPPPTMNWSRISELRYHDCGGDNGSEVAVYSKAKGK